MLQGSQLAKETRACTTLQGGEGGRMKPAARKKSIDCVRRPKQKSFVKQLFQSKDALCVMPGSFMPSKLLWPAGNLN